MRRDGDNYCLIGRIITNIKLIQVLVSNNDKSHFENRNRFIMGTWARADLRLINYAFEKLRILRIVIV